MVGPRQLCTQCVHNFSVPISFVKLPHQVEVPAREAPQPWLLPFEEARQLLHHCLTPLRCRNLAADDPPDFPIQVDQRLIHRLKRPCPLRLDEVGNLGKGGFKRRTSGEAFRIHRGRFGGCPLHCGFWHWDFFTGLDSLAPASRFARIRACISAGGSPCGCCGTSSWTDGSGFGSGTWRMCRCGETLDKVPLSKEGVRKSNRPTFGSPEH
jgi:hypothetical protein